MLKIDNLRVKIEDKEILKGVSLEIGRGEVVAVMGPNGSGKSTLAGALIGNPVYETSGGTINFENNELNELTPDARANLGVYLAFQYPVAIPGVRVRELLLTSLREKHKDTKFSALEIKQRIQREAEALNLNEELLMRSINEGFSGGEKKKMEILQMSILEPKLLILDEIDSGLDIDALEVIAKRVRKMVEEKGTSVLVITHYQRLLKHLVPDKVLVMKNGEIVDRGGNELVEVLEKGGYKSYE